MVHSEKIRSLVHDAAGSSPSSIYLSMMRRNLGEVLPEEK